MTVPPSGIWIIQRTIPHYRMELFRRLRALYGVQVLTASNPPDGDFLKYSDINAISAVQVPFSFHRKDPFQVNVPIKGFLEDYKPTAVMAEFGLRYSSSYSLAFARRTGQLPRLAFWTHGWQMERGFKKLTDLTIQAARIPLFYQADAIATYGEEGARWVKRWCPGKAVFSVGNSLDEDKVRQAAAAAQPIRFGSPNLLAIGRLKADKGFDLLLNAFKQVRKSLPEAALTIIGDGPEQQSLRAMADRMGLNGIIFTGGLYDENELAPYFTGSDFLIVPGAAGLSVNHAIAYLLPVIAFSRSGAGPFHHPEIEYVTPGTSGVLVPNYSAEALSLAIVEAHKSGASKRLKAQMAVWSDAPRLTRMTTAFGEIINYLVR